MLTWFEFAVLGLTVLAAAPFVVFAYPPIADMPNHVARLFLECHRADPAYSTIYTVRAALIPNVSMDLVNLALCGVMGPASVFKALLVASLAVIAMSAIVIQRKAAGPSVGLLVLPATALNLLTYMGYVNFLSGVAVVFAMVAILLGRQDDRRVVWPVCVVGGVILILCHVFALALGMVSVFGLLLRRPITTRGVVATAVRTTIPFLPALVLFALAEKPHQTFSIGYGEKIFALAVPFMSGAPGLYAVFVSLVMSITVIVIALRRRKAASWPLWCAGAISLAYGLLLPFRIGDAIDLGARTVAAALPLLALAIPPRPKAWGTPLLAAACLALFAMHVHTQLTAWPNFGDQIREFKVAEAYIPPGSKVLSAWIGLDGLGNAAISTADYTHLASYAVVDRRAFDPLEFTGRGMQPLTVTAQYAPITPNATRPLLTETARTVAHFAGPLNKKMREADLGYALSWPEHFDRVIYYHFGDTPNFDPEELDIVHAGSFFSILKPKDGKAH